MGEISEADLMVICVEAAKNIVKEYSIEVNNALGRIADTMHESRINGDKVTIRELAENPVDRDVVMRATATTIGLVFGLGE